MQYLCFESCEVADGICALEVVASTGAAQHAAALAEVQQLLDWAWCHFPHTHGPVDDGMDWDHDLQMRVEPGGWHTLTLSLAASERFAAAFQAAWYPEPGLA